jgi:hypothetical protein
MSRILQVGNESGGEAVVAVCVADENGRRTLGFRRVNALQRIDRLHCGLRISD